tara:strand:+ start:1115 stop:1591 length:477 start_codon:yes stop_codon:yes gene_type:complete
MDLNKDNQLKFTDGATTDPLTIISAGSVDLEYGPKYVVNIKPTIEGFDHFMPSPGLVNKIKEENVDVDDIITIEKVGPSEKYQYGYFNVKVVEKNAKGETKAAEPTHKSIEKFEKQFEPKDDKMDQHELTLRVEKLEKMVAVLSSEAGHKPGDEELPF